MVGSERETPDGAVAVAATAAPLPADPRPGCLDCPVRHFGFCRALDRAEVLQLAQRSIRTTLPAHHSLGIHGDLPELSVVVSGYLRRVHHSADGHRQVTDLILPGEAVDPRSGDGLGELETATTVELCRINLASFHRVMASSHRLRKAMYAQAQVRLERLRSLTLTLAVLQPRARLAEFLTRCVGVMPWQPLPAGGGVLTMELGRQDIAGFLGTTVETISRILHALQEEGFLKIRDARHFEIGDLRQLAGEGGLGLSEAQAAEYQSRRKLPSAPERPLTAVNEDPRQRRYPKAS